MRQATLFGYHGRRNFGDDIFLRLAIHWLKSYFQIQEIWVTAQPTYLPHYLEGVKLHPLDPPGRYIGRLKWWRILKAALKSDLLLFSGGSLFRKLPFGIFCSTMKTLRLRRPELKIAGMGVSIGPFDSSWDQKCAGLGLQVFDHIMLRDEASQLRLVQMEVPIPRILSWDLALAWAFPNDFSPQPKVLGVALNHAGYWSGPRLPSRDDQSLVLHGLREILKQWPDWKLKLLVTCSDQRDGDLEIAQKIWDALKDFQPRLSIVVYDGFSPRQFAREIGSCSAMIASRMHAGVMAMRMGVPLYQISYGEKIRALFEHTGLDDEDLVDVQNFCPNHLIDFLNRVSSYGIRGRTKHRKEILEKQAQKVLRDMKLLAHYLGS